MHGFPRKLATRHDYERLHAAAVDGQANRVEMLRRWRSLLATRQHYVFDRTLATEEQPDGTEPEYRVLDDDEGERSQFRLTDAPNALITRLGYSAADVEMKITELEAL
jgi:hypothetical protein